MKIMHILSSNSFSGAENVVCNIINNDKRNEHIYCSPNGSIANKLKDENITYNPLKRFNYFEIKKSIKKNKPDIIHAHDYKASIIAALFSKNAKIISHIHGNNKKVRKLNLNSIIYLISACKFHKIIWVSKSSLDDYYFKNKILKKSIVLYNIIDSEKVRSNSLKVNSKKNYDIIYLGRIGYPKNVERLIDIIKIIVTYNEKLKVAIVGNGPDFEKIKGKIKALKLQNNITLFGYLTNPYPILKNSKVLTMTSIYEGTPMCVLEAMSLGKPVISTPIDGLNDIIMNDYNGYLTDDNYDYANKVLEIINNNSKYKIISKNSQLFFEKYNNIKVYIDKLNLIYK